MTDNVGERTAGLEAAFKSFRTETLKDMEYIRNKLDAIADSLSRKVDRPYCQDRHEKTDRRVMELEKNGKREEIMKRIRMLEQRAPAIVQQAVVAIITAILTATAVKMLP